MNSLALWTGYYCNEPIRELGRAIERFTRPWIVGEAGFEDSSFEEAAVRIKKLFNMIVCTPVSFVASPLSFAFYAYAHYASRALEIVDEDAKPISRKNFTLLSLNVCFQEGPFAPQEGGVVPPFERVGKYVSRVAALVDWIGRKNPHVFVGQEFSDYAAQDAFVKGMKKYGYRHFVLHRGPHTLFMNSGLIVASKYKLSDISFIPFPLADRMGGALITQKGAIDFSLCNKKGERLFRVINTHLNAHYGESADSARYRQLKNHIVPRFRSKDPTILVGDFNFDTSVAGTKLKAGLNGFKNIFEGKVTWSTEGKTHLRGSKEPVVEEKIDVVFANSPALSFKKPTVAIVEEEGQLLADHRAISVSVHR